MAEQAAHNRLVEGSNPSGPMISCFLIPIPYSPFPAPCLPSELGV